MRRDDTSEDLRHWTLDEAYQEVAGVFSLVIARMGLELGYSVDARAVAEAQAAAYPPLLAGSRSERVINLVADAIENGGAEC